jgi:hypothetical protein
MRYSKPTTEVFGTQALLVMRHCNTVLVRYQTQEIIHRNRAATRLIDVMKQCAACRKR